MLKNYEMIQKTKIEGVRIVTGLRREDDRGFFEVLAEGELLEYLECGGFVQDNLSKSYQGVLRGLHIQQNQPQGKLIRCTYGMIWDVWVDLRPDSRTFKKWECLTLRSDHPESVYLPPGLAHGFFCFSSHAIVQYKCTTPYDKQSDGGILWKDKEVGVEWPFPSELTPTISGKDANLPTLREYLKQIG